MTIQQEIQAQYRLTREGDWLDLLARADYWTQEPDLDAQEFSAREWMRGHLYRVWHNLGRPESRVRWPSDITLADLQLRDVYSLSTSIVNAANSPKDVAEVWWEHSVPVGSSSWLIEQTQWLPLVSQLVAAWTVYPGVKAIVALAHDDNVTPQLWLELAQCGIEKLEAGNAPRL